MANYYPLIAKAVAGLEKNTGEARRTLYERARSALVAQLRSVNPPLSESDITRERLALEEAIRKVEADAVRRARAGAMPVGPERPLGEPPAERPRDAAAPPRGAPMDTGAVSPPEAPYEPSAAPHEEPETPQPPPRRFPLRPPSPRRDSAPWPAGSAEPSLAARRDAEPGPIHGEPGDHSFAPKDKGPPPDIGDEEAEPSEPPFPSRVEEAPRQRGGIGESMGPLLALASNRRVLGAVAVILIVFGLSGLVYWQWPTISGLFHRQATVATPTTPETTPSPPTKITDRIGAPGQNGRTQSGPAAAQRVVLYEEDPSAPSGKRFVGTAIWRTEQVAAGPGQAADVAVRADIEIPEPKVTVKWSLRRNTDKALPASHTIEIIFTTPPDSPNGAIANIPGILMKQAEQTRGVPLAGLAVKVTNGFFLIGLSSSETEVKRNVQLLKERAWFDVPVVYANGRRAILAIEKGAPGERAFAEAFAAWGE
jgi:hypothetical protein